MYFMLFTINVIIAIVVPTKQPPKTLCLVRRRPTLLSYRSSYVALAITDIMCNHKAAFLKFPFWRVQACGA